MLTSQEQFLDLRAIATGEIFFALAIGVLLASVSYSPVPVRLGQVFSIHPQEFKFHLPTNFQILVRYFGQYYENESSIK